MMQVAEMLSDLMSLQVCEPNAALALVSARPNGSEDKTQDFNAGREDIDPDLTRAKDLLELHASVKVAHQDGTDKELNNAREAVQRVLDML